MSWEFNQSETVENTGGSKYVNAEGTFHFLINDIDENPATKDHKPIEGALKVQAEVLAGTDSSQIGRTLETMFFKGRPTDKDGGEFANKKLTRFFLAIGLISHQPGSKTVIEPSHGVGRQFCAKINVREQNGKKYFDIAYADIWHIDDAEAKDIPKDAEALGLIDASQRKIEAKVDVGSLVDV